MTETLVVGVDGTADSLAAVTSAADLAEASGGRLVAVHVRHESGAAAASGATADTAAAMKETLDEIERLSRQRVSDVLAGRRLDWRFEVRSGDPASELIAAARTHQATTVIVGGRKHGVVGGLVLGSVAQKLVRHSPVSVLVVRDGQPDQLELAPS